MKHEAKFPQMNTDEHGSRRMALNQAPKALFLRHTSEGWYPDLDWLRPLAALFWSWVPAVAGMTGCIACVSAIRIKTSLIRVYPWTLLPCAHTRIERL
jgi:hypothetical protein